MSKWDPLCLMGFVDGDETCRFHSAHLVDVIIIHSIPVIMPLLANEGARSGLWFRRQEPREDLPAPALLLKAQ